MKKIIYTLIVLSISISVSAQITVTTGKAGPKFVGKEGKNTYRIKDVQLGFTKGSEEAPGNESLKKMYVIFKLNPNNGEKYPPQNPHYISKIYKFPDIPQGYDPKGYGNYLIRTVSKDFLKYCVETYHINSEHYTASFEANYDYNILEKNLASDLAYTNTGRLWVIDYGFTFNYNDDKYSYTYDPKK